MIGTVGATVIAIVYLLFTCVLGVAVGGVLSFLFQRSWGIKTAFFDAALAAVIATITGYAVAEIAFARHQWGTNLTPVLVISLAAVAIRHFVRLRFRKS